MCPLPHLFGAEMRGCDARRTGDENVAAVRATVAGDVPTLPQ